MKLGHNTLRHIVSPKIDNQVNWHFWITTLELFIFCLTKQP